MDPTTGQQTVDITFPGQTCCNQQPGPTLAGVRPGTFNLVNTPALVENIVVDAYGGDQVGALLLSPLVKRGSTSDTGYNHSALLRSLEGIFRLHQHIGYAADDPAADYFLDTFGNDRNIFKPDY